MLIDPEYVDQIYPLISFQGFDTIKSYLAKPEANLPPYKSLVCMKYKSGWPEAGQGLMRICFSVLLYLRTHTSHPRSSSQLLAFTQNVDLNSNKRQT